VDEMISTLKNTLSTVAVCSVFVSGVSYAAVSDFKQMIDGVPTSMLSSSTQRFDLRCWQKGKEIISEHGVGQHSIGEPLIKSAVSLYQLRGKKKQVQVFSMGDATCQLEITES